MIAYHTALRSEFYCDCLLDAVLLAKGLTEQGYTPIRHGKQVILNETRSCHSWNDSYSPLSPPP